MKNLKEMRANVTRIAFSVLGALALAACQPVPGTVTPEVSPTPTALISPPPTTPPSTATPLPPEINPEYLPLKAMLNSQKTPYEIVDGQIEVDGHKIIANNLGLIIFSDQTGIQTWNPETASWQAVDLADETTFTGDMKANVEDWIADMKYEGGNHYGNILPRHQSKFDSQYRFLMKTFLLSQTDFLNQNAEVIKSWGYESLKEMDNRHISWLFDKYNIENHRLSMLLPSETINGFGTGVPPITYGATDGKFYQGYASSFSLREEDGSLQRYLDMLPEMGPYILKMAGVKVETTDLLYSSIWGELMAAKIIPGTPKEKMIAIKILFGPSPIQPDFRETIRTVNFTDAPVLFGLNGPMIYNPKDMPEATFPEMIPARDWTNPRKFYTLQDFLDQLGSRVQADTFPEPIYVSNKPTYALSVYFLLGPNMMIPESNMFRFFEKDAINTPVWPWELPQ